MRKALLVTVVGLAVIALSIGVAWADHYVYNSEDPDYQRPEVPGIENYAFKWWALFDSLSLWPAEPVLQADVRTVLSNWNTALPRFTWLEVPPGVGGEVNVVFKSAPGRRGTIAHEIGHLYGLDDRYFQQPPPDCNFTETTVMDTGFFGADNLRYHCDGLEGPSATDVVRVNAFWSQGQYTNFTALPYQSWGRYRYQNDSWAAYDHRLVWFYWINQNPGVCCWVVYHSKTRTEGVGIHRLTGNRVFIEVVNAANYQVPLGTFWHIACGYPYFRKYNVLGTWRCSDPQIQLNT